MTIASTDSHDNTATRESRDWLRLMPLARELAPRIQIEDEQSGDLVDARGSVRQCLMRPSNGCRYHAQKDGQQAEISVRFDGHDLKFRGLYRCGCGWACPVCAARQSQIYRDRVLAIIVEQAEAGRRAIVAMGTVPHSRGESLATVYDRKEAVWDAFKTIMRRKYRSDEKIEYLMNNETSHHWLNSWHPHSHFIFFIPDSVPVKEFCEFFGEAWSKAAARFGLTISDKVLLAEEAVSAEFAAQYLTKADRENAAAELTGSQNKSARGEHLSPFEMLEKITEYRDILKRGERLERTDWRRMKRLEELYREYVNFYHGHVRKLRASHGIKLREPDEQQQAVDEQAEEKPAAPEIAVVEESGWTREAATDLVELRDELRKAAEPEDWYRLVFVYFVMRGAPPGAVRPGSGIDPVDWLTEHDIAAILAARDQRDIDDEMAAAVAAFWQEAA
jgi:hypothetical protein